MPERQPQYPTRRGSALKGISIGCAGVLILLIGALALTFGYFGPNLPRANHFVAYQQFIIDQSGVSPAQVARAEQLTTEIAIIRDQHIKPILETDAFVLGGTEFDDPDLPADQREAIERAVTAMGSTGMNARIDELVALGYSPENRSGLMRDLARFQTGALVVAWQAGDAEGAAAAYGRLLGIAHANAHGSLSVVGRLVAIAVEALASSKVRALLTKGPADERMATALLEAHRNAPPRDSWPGMAEVLEGEQLLARDIFADEGFSVPLRAVNPGAADQDFARLNQHALAAWTQSGQTRITTIRDEHDSWYVGLNPLAEMSVPAVELMLTSEIMAEAYRRATTTALAIEVFRARNAQPPSDLEQLVPIYLSEVPLDPCTDSPFVYKVDPASPVGYRLYSIGFDGIDNDGVAGDVDSAAFRLDASGIDAPIMPAAEE